MGVNPEPAGHKGCQVPHFSRYYNVTPNVCLSVRSNFIDRLIRLICHWKS
jgi:hypothetical protein